WHRRSGIPAVRRAQQRAGYGARCRRPCASRGQRVGLMAKVKTPRWGWALTGSGHFFKECLGMIAALDDVDLFVSKAAAEVVRMCRQELKLPKSARVFEDKTASAAPVGAFYYGTCHTLVVGPATSNTVAKCVFGISDTLVTNVFAQAGKCRVPAIVFACDTA